MTIKKIQQKQHSLTEKLLCAVIKGGGGGGSKNISWWSVVILESKFSPKPEETPEKKMTELVPVSLITFKKHIFFFNIYSYLFVNHQAVHHTASEWGVAWAHFCYDL